MTIDPNKRPGNDIKDKMENVYRYAATNTRETIAYVLLIFGLILIFFLPGYGGTLIGLVVGVYYYNELTYFIKHINQFIEENGTAKSLVLGAVFLALLISAPAIFIGALVAVALKHLFLAG